MKNTLPKLAIVALLVAQLLNLVALSAEGQGLEYRLKAELIERFTRFIEWPADSSVQDASVSFVICTIGKNPFDGYLDKLAKEVRIKDKKVEILDATDLKLINSCQIVFIASSEASRLPEVLTYTEGHPILTIGDTDGFASKGALINFYPSGEYVRFEVNSLAIQRSKLKFSSRLLKLARFVDDLRGSNASSQ